MKKQNLPFKILFVKDHLFGEKNGDSIGKKSNIVLKNVPLGKFLNYFWYIIFKVEKTLVTIFPGILVNFSI